MRTTCILLCASLASRLSSSPVDALAVPPTVVAVPGATGQTGRLVVRELLRRDDAGTVLAIVRNRTKAEEVFPLDGRPANLRVVSCDLTSPPEIRAALEDGAADAAIWCATGFAAAPPPTPTEAVPANGLEELVSKFQEFFGGKKEAEPEAPAAPPKSIDLIGLPVFAQYLLEKHASSDREDAPPNLVVLSSAGVTRPSWDEEKKKRLAGAADIPIVRLNPFGILGIKLASEDAVRASGVRYCVVRPCGLNDDWPAGARPHFSQGDVAVGRVNRGDVAGLLVDALARPEAAGKTFETLGLAGYPRADSIAPALSRLASDEEGGGLDPVSVAATYAALQQLLPGEKQDSAALAMGQSYEQLDKGQVGRFGKRGTEDAEAVAPKPTAGAVSN